MIELEDLRERLLGAELPVGTYRVRPYEAWLTADCLGTTTTGEGLHPIHVFLSTLVGVGYEIGELWDLVGATAEDGPMIGETDLEQVRPLRADETLTVRSTITDIVRKEGGSGTFDIVTVEITLTDADGHRVGRVANAYIYPRRTPRG